MLRIIRQNAGYQQLHAAKLLGHSNANALNAWENERAMPSGTNLIKLCILYNVQPRDLYPEYYKRIEEYFIFS